MATPIRVLVVEDHEDDAQLLIRELRKGGYAPQWTRVDTQEAMSSALAAQEWDVIVCDYALPHFDALAALKLIRAKDADLPFIIVSGKIGEETAVAAMKAGAHDYVMKDRLNRLPGAVERELRDAKLRRDHKRAEHMLEERVKELRAFFRLSEITDGRSLDDVCQEMANSLPESWQYAEVACARIVVGSREFRSANFAESPWMQSAPIRIHGSVRGKIEVGYLEQKPEEDEGPFLREEEQLVQAIAERIGRFADRKEAESAARVRTLWKDTLVKLFQLPAMTEGGILAFAIESLVALTQSKLGFLGFVDPAESTMSGHLWSAHAMQDCAMVAGRTAQFDVATGGLWVAPITEHRTIIVNDYAAPHPLKKGIPPGHVALTRFLGVPLIREGRTVLIAGLANRVEEYTRSDESEIAVLLEGLWGLIARQRAEKELLATNDLFSLFIRHSPIYTVIKTVTPHESRVLHASENFGEMPGGPRGNLEGRTMLELFPPELAAKVTADDWAVAAKGEVVKVTQEFGGRTYDTIQFPIVRGDETLLAGYSIDITERKRAEQERVQLEEQLRVSQKMEAVGSLAGGVAHDFNNLVCVILNNAKFALDSTRADAPIREDLLEIAQAGESAAALTRQLLAFSRKQVLQPVALDLNDVTNGIEKMLRRVLNEDIAFVRAVGPGLGLVLADPGQIEQVLMNLVVNARDAMPEGGRLTIETANVDLAEGDTALHVTAMPGPYVQLAVSDTGIGMDERTLARIFEPFFTTKETGKGTGLGLATVYGIVRQSGGSLSVHSELGKGTTFKIYLPRLDSGTVAPREAVADSGARLRGTETILLVEDMDALRKVAEKALTAHGYTVLSAANGEEALELSHTHPGDIHLLLTDVVMPNLGGKALATQLTRDDPSLAVLFMSGYTDGDIVHRGVLDAGTHFLGKPFTGSSLVRKVRDVLDERAISLAEGAVRVAKPV